LWTQTKPTQFDTHTKSYLSQSVKFAIITRSVTIKAERLTLSEVMTCEEREKNQQDATIRCLLSTSVPTCLKHHYVHLQENKDRVLLHMVYCSGSAGCGW